ncbi:MAG TPA: polysaccharide biosynthesis C-terminal domain-containing protein, partial [Gemmatimonadales bacterium]|nr:polysaccharide biosynthesis C-terminal domain-containing protein [Gemmatimonadales bacterium]
LPLFAVAILTLVHSRVDTVMLGFMGTYRDVASYQAAYKLLEASRFAVRPATTVLFPLLAAMAVRREWDGLRTYMGRALASAGWIGLGIAAVLALGADVIVRLAFGRQYADAAPLLRVLVLSLPLLFVGNIAMMVSQAICRERDLLVRLAVCLVINVGANLIAIPRWGPLGAAWTTVGSELLLCVLLLRANAVWLVQPLVVERSAA